jgi:hypothetical protein
MSLEQERDPRIRVYDVVAHGSSAAGLEVAAGRHLDLPVSELTRLLDILGADGLQAFCLYVEHLEQVPGVDGDLVLGVPHFSARWLLSASADAAERTGTTAMTKNAATRGHQAVERSGLLHALANAPAVAGQGARGRTWRAVLNPRLVVIRGGREDLDELPQIRRGRPRKDQSVPDSRFPRNRDPRPTVPESGNTENQGTFPLSPEPGKRETGLPDPASDLVGAVSPGSAIPDSTSAVGVVHELLSSNDRPGLLATTVVPALRADRTAVLLRLRPLFNQTPVGERSLETLTALSLPVEETRRPDVLGELIAATLLGERDTATDLRQLGVSGTPVLTEHELRERLVVGLLIGWGLRRVSSWGAWLYQATRPGWSPKPGPLLDSFTQHARALTTVPDGAPVKAAPASIRPQPLVAPPPPAPEEALLPEETVNRFFTAARRKWPMFCRDGSVQASDPVWRSRLVRMYLTAEEHHVQLETTEQMVSR